LAAKTSPLLDSDAERLRFALGATGRMGGWTGPDNPLGIAVFGVLQKQNERWALRGSALWTTSQSSVDDRGARFQVLALRVEGCATVLGGHGGLTLGSCVAVGGGAMFASGLSTSNLLTATAETVPWLDAAFILRVATPALWGIRFEAQAELGSPLLRHDFEFDAPKATVFRVAPGVTPALGVGVLVPL
jgi:hypothetical protein